MQIQTIIGLDVGRSAVKATAYANGAFHRLTYPSIVSPAIGLTDESTAKRAEAETVEVLGKRYFTGDTARLQGSAGTTVGLSHDWINTPEYLALVASTMKRFAALGVPGLADPMVVIGTPASLYGAQQDQLKTETLKIVKADIRVLPQPMGAYCDYFLDQSGVPIKQHMADAQGRKKSWAVVEAGHFTTDFLLMLEGQYIERGAQSCEGLNFAAEQLLRILNGKGIHTNLIECEEAIRTKTLFDCGVETDISADVAIAVAHIAQKIIAKADSVLSTDVRKLNGVLIAGGGATLVYEELKKKWPHCVLLENPRMSVANGFCRYGMGIALRRAMRSSDAQETANA